MQAQGDVRFGSKADMCSASGHVRFTPDSDLESGLSQNDMSALPPRADMCGAKADVCFGPIADISRSLSNLLWLCQMTSRHIPIPGVGAPAAPAVAELCYLFRRKRGRLS